MNGADDELKEAARRIMRADEERPRSIRRKRERDATVVVVVGSLIFGLAILIALGVVSFLD